jgi:hypothetical protein
MPADEPELERLHCYASALDTALHAAAQARELFDEAALEQAMRRLRLLLERCQVRLLQIERQRAPPRDRPRAHILPFAPRRRRG